MEFFFVGNFHQQFLCIRIHIQSMRIHITACYNKNGKYIIYTHGKKYGRLFLFPLYSSKKWGISNFIYVLYRFRILFYANISNFSVIKLFDIRILKNLIFEFIIQNDAFLRPSPLFMLFSFPFIMFSKKYSFKIFSPVSQPPHPTPTQKN